MRLPEARVEAALALSGRRLEVAGAALALGDAKTRPLVSHATLYSHRVVSYPLYALVRHFMYF
jgi:hypothetical protein